MSNSPASLRGFFTCRSNNSTSDPLIKIRLLIADASSAFDKTRTVAGYSHPFQSSF